MTTEGIRVHRYIVTDLTTGVLKKSSWQLAD